MHTRSNDVQAPRRLTLAIELIGGPSATIENLQKLDELLRNARAAGVGPEQIEKKIAEDIPSFSKLADLLPRTRGELYAFIAIILTVIGLALQARSNSDSPDITVNQVINNVTNEINITSNVTTYKREEPKVGRNEPCPCGSGKKYKKCHGQ